MSNHDIEDEANPIIRARDIPYQAIVIVILIMLIFLGFRTGIIVSAMVPMAILIMSFFHIDIDQMSLASLIIALGMLVDNGIFMAESIMVKMAAGGKTI